MSKEEIIAAITETAAKLGRAPTLREMMMQFPHTRKAVRKHFGTYTRAVGACGLERSDDARPVSTEELFRDWAFIVRTLGRMPSLNEYTAMSKYSYRPVVDRFEKWIWVPKGMLSFAEKQGLEKEWADVLEKVAPYYECKRLRDSDAPGATTKQTAGRTTGHTSEPTLPHTSGTTTGWMNLPPLMTDRPSYGPPMKYSALAHEPVNEAGVLFLFGAMAEHLGFMALRLQSQFPDCEAMRRMEGNRWQKVRIELEFESANFVDHMHDAKGCDLIVCWIHNWKECPLEVVELRRIAAI